MTLVMDPCSNHHQPWWPITSHSLLHPFQFTWQSWMTWFIKATGWPKQWNPPMVPSTIQHHKSWQWWTTHKTYIFSEPSTWNSSTNQILHGTGTPLLIGWLGWLTPTTNTLPWWLNTICTCSWAYSNLCMICRDSWRHSLHASTPQNHYHSIKTSPKLI